MCVHTKALKAKCRVPSATVINQHTPLLRQETGVLGAACGFGPSIPEQKCGSLMDVQARTRSHQASHVAQVHERGKPVFGDHGFGRVVGLVSAFEAPIHVFLLLGNEAVGVTARVLDHLVVELFGHSSLRYRK